MQLRRFLTGLTAMAVVGISSLSYATMMVPCGALDCTVVRSGKASLIISGKVTDAKTITVNFPNSIKPVPATDFTIVGEVIKGSPEYQASETPQTVHVKFFGAIDGPTIKNMLRPVVGAEGMHIFYGNSVLGLTSYAFGPEGFTAYVAAPEGGGKMMAVSPYGNGLVFNNKALAAKFAQVNPAGAKLLRSGPVVPVEGGEGQGAAPAGDVLTPDMVTSAVKVILKGDKE